MTLHRLSIARPVIGLLPLLALTLTVAAARSVAAGEPLAKRLDSVLGERALRGARVAAFVEDFDDGSVLYQREADRLLVPASNQKILTSLAALDAFGPTHSFATQVFADRAPGADGSIDFLGLRGGGDPGLTSEEFWRLAADLRMKGLRRVRRGLLLDDGAFDDVRWHPGWGPVSARAYHAPIGALTVNYGTFAVAVEPGSKRGAAVSVAIDPLVPFLRLVNRASTSDAGGGRSLVVDRESAGAVENVIVSGMMPVGTKRKVYYRSVLDPALLAGAVFRIQLEANGISVGGEVRRGPLPDSAVLLHEHRGKSLAELVRLFMKYSNNAMGESLVKSLGARASGGVGSWENGVPALRAQLVAAGLNVEGLQISDGSGLSYDNRVTPRHLVRALRLAADSFRFGPEFSAALPIAAGDGTLEERAEGAAHLVRAKTGLLTRVTALSGYATLPDGRRAVFSVIANGFRGSAERAMAAIDHFAAALVEPD